MPTTVSWIAVNDGSGITILPLNLGSFRSDQVFGRSFSAMQVGAHRHADQMHALRDPGAVLVLGAIDHLVEAVRLERHEHALARQPGRGAGVRHGDDVGAGLAGLVLLQEAPQHRFAARAQQRHLDAGVGRELVGQDLHQRERRRGVPADVALFDRGGAVGLIGGTLRGAPARRGDAGRAVPRQMRCNAWCSSQIEAIAVAISCCAKPSTYRGIRNAAPGCAFAQPRSRCDKVSSC